MKKIFVMWETSVYDNTYNSSSLLCKIYFYSHNHKTLFNFEITVKLQEQHNQDEELATNICLSQGEIKLDLVS